MAEIESAEPFRAGRLPSWQQERRDEIVPAADHHHQQQITDEAQVDQLQYRQQERADAHLLQAERDQQSDIDGRQRPAYTI
jgi:hypothetical protein